MDPLGGLTWGDHTGHTPWYKRLDAKIELRHDTNRFPHVIRFAGYVLLQNIGGIENVREYWWDETLTPQPVNLAVFDIHFGVRAHMRF